jgi:hypothetical protein
MFRHDVDQHRRAARAEDFVREFFVVHVAQIADSLLDGALDHVVGHVDPPRLVHGRTQAGIAVDIAAAQAGRDRDLLDHLGPDLGLLGVRRLFFVLDLGPAIVP